MMRLSVSVSETEDDPRGYREEGKLYFLAFESSRVEVRKFISVCIYNIQHYGIVCRIHIRHINRDGWGNLVCYVFPALPYRYLSNL